MSNMTEIIFSNQTTSKMKEELLKIFFKLISNGDQTTLEWFYSHEILGTIRLLLSNDGNSQAVYYCCTSIIEKLLQFENETKVSKATIIEFLMQNGFVQIFERIFFSNQTQNSRLKQQIDRILEICYNKDHEQMVMI
jgi:hypothetical protein